MRDVRWSYLGFCTLVWVVRAVAQAPAGSILRVEIENATLYVRGYCGPSDRGQNPNKLPRPTYGPLGTFLGIGDIVSVNGQPVQGTAFESTNGVIAANTFTPGRAIADFAGGPTATSWDLAFLNFDGTLIGTIHIDGQGSAAGTRPPGAPKEFTGGSVYTVTGGTGPFLGSRGYFEPPQDTVSGERQTTDCEDPAYRRINADPGGNKRHGLLYLVPLSQPHILITTNGPEVFHADFSPVNAAKPARSGEVLIAKATGLGPTRPGVDPGEPFPTDALQEVNSPVSVTVNGSSAEVINKVGWAGLVDTYRVDFRVPDGIPAGSATIRLTAAWIGGPPVSIPTN